MSEPPPYGLLAEFDRAEHLAAAARAAHAAGYRKLDAFAPFPVEGLDEALGPEDGLLPAIVFLGGLAGAVTGFGMQWFANVIQYPQDIGGRPYNSWPAFIPITFELTILFAAGAAVLGMLAVNGLPQPHHPVFAVPRFELASRHAFFLCIESSDPRFETAETRAFLETLKPVGVYEAPPW